MLKTNAPQFTINTDYSKWERRHAARLPLPQDRLLGVRNGGGAAAAAKPKSAGDPQQRCPPAVARGLRPSDASGVAGNVRDHAAALEARARSQRKLVDGYRRRQEELLRQNIALRGEIEATEGPALADVKQLLRRYEKFRGGMSHLNEKFLDSLQSEQGKLHELRVRCDRELADVQASVDALDERLRRRLDEIHVLQNYKDKEYPVKAMRVLELLKEIDRVEADCTEERSELEHVVDVELTKLRGAEQSIRDRVMAGASERALTLMHPSLRDMALQNQVMAREIEAHAVSIRATEREIAMLRTEVEQLLRDPATNVRLQLFPEFFRQQAKCSPDDDIVLDIERHQLLPI